MPALFLLGPSKWAQGYAPPNLPAWAYEHLPKDPVAGGTPSPLDIRRALAARLGVDGHRVVVMETFPDTPGEPRTEKFSRLVEELEVRRFVLYWPFGANRSGLDVEIGFELERLRRRELEGVAVPPSDPERLHTTGGQ